MDCFIFMGMRLKLAYSELTADDEKCNHASAKTESPWQRNAIIQGDGFSWMGRQARHTAPCEHAKWSHQHLL